MGTVARVGGGAWLVAMAAAFAPPAAAQADLQWKWCTRVPGVSADQMVDACSARIVSGQEGQQTLAIEDSTPRSGSSP